MQLTHYIYTTCKNVTDSCFFFFFFSPYWKHFYTTKNIFTPILRRKKKKTQILTAKCQFSAFKSWQFNHMKANWIFGLIILHHIATITLSKCIYISAQLKRIFGPAFDINRVYTVNVKVLKKVLTYEPNYSIYHKTTEILAAKWNLVQIHTFKF